MIQKKSDNFEKDPIFTSRELDKVVKQANALKPEL